MKAAQISEYGDPGVIQIADIPAPGLKDGGVVVEVQAASLNPFDTSVRAGYMQEVMPLQLPATLGGDIAGTITQIADGVTGFAVGDKVYGQANAVGGNSGAFAEYASTTAKQVAAMPANLNFQEAAAMPLVGVSAWQALTQHLELSAGHKLFITGGAGGIGRVAIQLAKHIGAYVATTATGEGVEAARSLGADEVIDYKEQDFTSMLFDYDAVFDTVGGDQVNQTLQVLKDGGKAVSMIAQFDTAAAEARNLIVQTQMTKVSTEALDTLRELIETGVIKPAIGQVFKLDDVKAAFETRESGAVQGKIVLEI